MDSCTRVVGVVKCEILGNAMSAMSWMENLSEQQIEEIGSFARDWAFLHGITVRTPEAPEISNKAMHVSMTMFPSPVKRQFYNEALALQSEFNLLMFRVACDHDFLEHCLKSVIKVDSYTRGLWDIYQSVRKEGVTQPYALCLFRNDFMVHCPNEDEMCLKQVEFNVIASSLASLAQEVSGYHRFLMSSYLGVFGEDTLNSRLPQNDPNEGMAKGLVKAWQLFGQESAVILLVCSQEIRNIFDQRQLEIAIIRLDSRIKVIRRSLRQVCDRASMNSMKDLVIDDNTVAVTYFRSGYTHRAYPSEKEWAARLLIERSSCIKCPSINVHLAGAKKVQQELCKSGVVERYLKDADAAARIRATFMGQFSLETGPVGDQMVSMALATPDNFVLKPQREGGGNNLHGQDMVPLLKEIQHSEERNAYVLMELIKPWVVRNVFIMPGLPVTSGDVTGELGVFGVLLAYEDEVIENRFVGTLLRTKFSDVKESRVLIRAACVDSPLLVD